MDVIISIIALIFSIIAWYNSDYTSKMIAKKTLDNVFFGQIYSEFILVQIPEKMNKLNSKQKDESVLFELVEEILMVMLEKSIFYKFFNIEFYNAMKRKILEIEDLVASDNDFEVKLNKTEKLIIQLYEILKDEYSYSI